MPRETQFKDFKAQKTYRCTPMNALPAAHMSLELVQLFGSALTAMFTGVADDASLANIARLAMSDGMATLTRAEHDRVLMTMLGCVHYGDAGPSETLGTERAFNDHFNEHGLVEAYSVLFWSMQVNFRAFFPDAAALLRLKTPVAAEAPKAGI